MPYISKAILEEYYKMAHIITYERLTEENELSEAGVDIFDNYVDDGKLVMEVSVDNVVTLSFPDEATADAYLAEIQATGDGDAKSHLRGNVTRTNT